FSFSVVQPPSALEFVVSKGAMLLARTPDGRDLPRGGNTLQVGQTNRPLPLRIRPADGALMESVSVSVREERLRELLGAPQLPDARRRVAESEDPPPRLSHAMTPRLFRSLDELSNEDARGASRRLWYQGKSLELVALVIDEIVEAASAQGPSLSAFDIDRL